VFHVGVGRRNRQTQPPKGLFACKRFLFFFHGQVLSSLTEKILVSSPAMLHRVTAFTRLRQVPTSTRANFYDCTRKSGGIIVQHVRTDTQTDV
jgi:hypothetical protein